MWYLGRDDSHPYLGGTSERTGLDTVSNDLMEKIVDTGTMEQAWKKVKANPKPDGSMRNLGIANMIDRVIQQAILIVLTPVFDPEFSESSYGFRPKRSDVICVPE